MEQAATTKIEMEALTRAAWAEGFGIPSPRKAGCAAYRRP